MGSTSSADARFLRRILMGLVMLTLATGAIATYTTVSAMSAEGVDLCTTTGLLCSN
jgi:fluoride ion exporter CrcB/FEX